jgi:two-component system phosphate regulon response regulator PhoB
VAPLVLIVDDARDLVASLEYSLTREGYATRTAYDGREALDAAVLDPLPDLILLDLNLPEISGTGVCAKLKRDERTRGIPIVMLTARADESDRVVGFELGADDYVVKPFSVRELVLRIRAILRRAASPEASPGRLSAGELSVDVPAHRVFLGSEEILLTALEFKLLHAFFQRRGRALSRETLLDTVWDVQADVTTRTVDAHVKRLREKLGSAGAYIETLRGVGYRFAGPEDV